MPSLPHRPPRAYTRIDWMSAAKLLAAGHAADAAAAAIGIDDDRLWRHWRRSQRFRNWVRREMDHLHGLAAMQLEVAGTAAALRRCQRPDGLPLDAATLALLAGGAFKPGADASPAERLAKHNARPRRPKPKPASEAELLGQARGRIVAALAVRAAQPIPPATAAPPEPEKAPEAEKAPDVPSPQSTAPDGVRRDPAVDSGPQRDAAGHNGPQRDAAVPSGTERAETGQAETGQAETGQAEEGQAEKVPRAPPPEARPLPGRWRWGARSDFITDLPSPDFPDGIPVVDYPPARPG